MGNAIQKANIGSKVAAGPAATFEPMLGFQNELPMEHSQNNCDAEHEWAKRADLKWIGNPIHLSEARRGDSTHVRRNGRKIRTPGVS